MTVEQLVRAMLARSLPERIAGEAADDLFEDHRRLRETRGSFSAALFLIREATSLVGAFVAAAMSRFVRSLATLRRDLAHAVRAVMRRPGSSLGAILMLAAGLAAVAASSGLASTLLFRPNQHSLSGRGPPPGLIRSRRPHAAGVFGSRARTRARQHGRRREHRGGEPSAGGAARWRHRHADAGRSRGRPLLRHDRPRRRGGPAARRRRRRRRRTAGGRDQRRALAGSLWPPGLGAGRRDSIERPRLHDCGHHRAARARAASWAAVSTPGSPSRMRTRCSTAPGAPIQTIDGGRLSCMPTRRPRREWTRRSSAPPPLSRRGCRIRGASAS